MQGLFYIESDINNDYIVYEKETILMETGYIFSNLQPSIKITKILKLSINNNFSNNNNNNNKEINNEIMNHLKRNTKLIEYIDLNEEMKGSYIMKLVMEYNYDLRHIPTYLITSELCAKLAKQNG